MLATVAQFAGAEAFNRGERKEGQELRRQVIFLLGLLQRFKLSSNRGTRDDSVRESWLGWREIGWREGRVHECGSRICTEALDVGFQGGMKLCGGGGKISTVRCDGAGTQLFNEFL